MSSVDTQVTTVEVDPTTMALWRYQGTYTFVGYDESTEEELEGWSREDIETVVERVNRGGLLLDQDRNDWVEEILPQKLDMASDGFCIIGQVYGGYGQYVGVPFGMSSETVATSKQAIDAGFITQIDRGFDTKSSIPYALLDRVWVQMLAERRERGTPVVLTLPPDESLNKIRKRLIDAKLLTATLAETDLSGAKLIEDFAKES